MVPIPVDVLASVVELSKEPMQSVALYFLRDSMAYLQAHVYRVNGVIEAKTRVGFDMGCPLRVYTVKALRAFLAPKRRVEPYCMVVVFRGNAPPPARFIDTTVLGMVRHVREHFAPQAQSVRVIRPGVWRWWCMRDCTMSWFGAYAWELLKES